MFLRNAINTKTKSFVFHMSLLVMSLIFLFSSCKEQTTAYKTQTALGTVCTLQLYDYGTDALYKKLFARLDEIEELFSPSIVTSEISHLNTASGEFPVVVSDDVFYLLEKSLYFAELSGGYFEPTIGSLVNLWNVTDFNPKTDSLPTEEEIQKARSLVGYKKLQLDHDKKSAYLEQEGMSVDLGAIAKGWAADELVAILKKEKVPYAIINLGGNIYVYGKKDNEKLWSVGIKDPFDSQGEPVIRLALENTSVVTSGLYERFFEFDGVRYHHILDVDTGYPIVNELVSVTIVHDSSMTADAYSTMLFGFGLEKALSFANENGINAILIDKEGSVFGSKTIVDKIEILNPDFVLYN